LYLKRVLNPHTRIKSTSLCVEDFWSWAYSNILTNITRGIFAEFLVGSVLGLIDEPRKEWETADFKYKRKLIEVKSASYLQNWTQEKLSSISFDIAERLAYDSDNYIIQGKKIRPANIYVFCLYTEKKSKELEKLLDVHNWNFYVMSTEKMNKEFGEQKNVVLNRIKEFAECVLYEDLKSAIELEMKK